MLSLWVARVTPKSEGKSEIGTMPLGPLRSPSDSNPLRGQAISGPELDRDPQVLDDYCEKATRVARHAVDTPTSVLQHLLERDRSLSAEKVQPATCPAADDGAELS